MCFVYDSDWYAMVNEEADITTAGPMKCDECGQTIPANAFAHTIHQQEHEECQDCEYGYCDCPVECCQCEAPNFGESFDYVRCEGCDKFLKAIEAAEIEEGCRKWESRPAMPMREDLGNLPRRERKKYWQKAAKMFPELVASGHLARLWKML